jgi:hypothetical protein
MCLAISCGQIFSLLLALLVGAALFKGLSINSPVLYFFMLCSGMWMFSWLSGMLSYTIYLPFPLIVRGFLSTAILNILFFLNYPSIIGRISFEKVIICIFLNFIFACYGAMASQKFLKQYDANPGQINLKMIAAVLPIPLFAFVWLAILFFFKLWTHNIF